MKAFFFSHSNLGALFVAFATGFGSLAALAQSSVSIASPHVNQTEGVGVEQLVALALSHNAGLLATRQRLIEAKGLLRQASFKLNPSLDTSFGTGAAFGSSNLNELSVGYNHTFLRRFARITH